MSRRAFRKYIDYAATGLIFALVIGLLALAAVYILGDLAGTRSR
jgi:hypothetical protein